MFARYAYVFLWDAFVWAGWAYLVTVHGWSPWWVFLALAMTMTTATKKKE